MRLTPQTLRTIRKVYGCTQQRIADLIGVDESYINKIERGHKPLTDDLERRIRRALGVTDDHIAQVMELCKRLEVEKRAI